MVDLPNETLHIIHCEFRALNSAEFIDEHTKVRNFDFQCANEEILQISILAKDCDFSRYLSILGPET
jgi:hypothetical protein